jgi:hypothetical protein
MYWNRVILYFQAAAARQLAGQLCEQKIQLAHFHFGGTYEWDSNRFWRCPVYHLAQNSVPCLEKDLEELLAFRDAPKPHRKRLRTTNVVERLFVEVRRRIRTMCAFTTKASCERILFSVFDRMNQHWTRHPLPAFTPNS